MFILLILAPRGFSGVELESNASSRRARRQRENEPSLESLRARLNALAKPSELGRAEPIISSAGGTTLDDGRRGGGGATSSLRPPRSRPSSASTTALSCSKGSSSTSRTARNNPPVDGGRRPSSSAPADLDLDFHRHTPAEKLQILVSLSPICTRTSPTCSVKPWTRSSPPLGCSGAFAQHTRPRASKLGSTSPGSSLLTYWNAPMQIRAGRTSSRHLSSRPRRARSTGSRPTRADWVSTLVPSTFQLLDKVTGS